MRRTSRGLALGLAVAALAAWGLHAGWFPALETRTDGARESDAPAPAEVDLEEAAREELGRLRSLPGMKLDRRGSGSIVGRVTLFVPGVGEKPLPDVDVEVLGLDEGLPGGTESRASATTGPDGAFTLAPVRVLPGYVLRARHAPHRDLVVRGIAVSAGHETDVGTIAFGAPTTLSGSVRDGVGRPVGEALVTVERDRSKGGSIDLLRALREMADGPGPLAQGMSHADGTFSLDGLPPGRYLVRVTHPGHAAAFVSGVYVTADGDSSAVRVVLDPGAGFVGRVVDEHGEGLEGAVVVALPVRAEKADSFDRQATTSGQDGAYRVDTLTPGTSYFLEAHRAGFAATGRILRAQGVSNVDLVLVAGGRLEGRVTDSKSGAPVPLAEVLALTGLVGSGTAPVSTLADAAGRYAFENVLPGPLILLEVRAPGYGPATQGYDAKAPRTIRSGETLVADVVVTSGGVVVGTVRDDAGKFLPYVSVAATQPGNRWAGETAALTDAQGAYRLDGLRWGSYVVAVTAPGYAAPIADAEVKAEVTEAAPQVVRDFVLRIGAVVTGIVSTTDKAPAVGARVAVLARDATQYGSRVRDLVGVADGSGAYRIVGAPPEIDLVIEATSDAGVRTVSESFRGVAGETKTVNLVLSPGAKIVGRAVDAAGRAVPGASVRYGHVEPEDAGRLRDSYRADDFLAPRTFRTDDDGRFACDQVPPGLAILKVDAEGYTTWYRKDLQVPAEGDLAGVTATLDGAKSIRGRVLASDTGRGIAGAWLYATVSEVAGAAMDDGRVRTLVSTETAADGTYALDRLPPGTVDVVVWLALGYRNAWEDKDTARRDGVATGSSSIDFRLLPVVVPPGQGR